MADDSRKTVGQYWLIHKIGAGSFAEVWKAQHMTTGDVVAIKEIKTDRLDVKLKQSLMSEIQILEKITHPNIVRLHDTIHASDRIYLVLEYCAGGDLARHIDRKRFSQTVVRNIMKQLGAGLQVLRAKNLIHRDLKPQNLLLTSNDDDAVLKIADFGFARSLQPQGLAETHCGSPLYMAPEILQHQKYDAKADLWSVGAILFHLMIGRPPFPAASLPELMKNIKHSKLLFPENLLKEFHPDCVDLCRKLLCQNPVERLSFEEFFNHPFMRAERVEEVGEQAASAPVVALQAHKSDSVASLANDVGHFPMTAPSTTVVKQPSCVDTFPYSVQTGTISGERTYVNKQGTAAVDSRPRSGSWSSDKHHPTSSSRNRSRAVEIRQPGVSIGHRSSLRDGEDDYLCGGTSRGGTLVDSMESIERDYVLVASSMATNEMMLSLPAGDRCLSKGEGSSQANFSCVRVTGSASPREKPGMSVYNQAFPPVTVSPQERQIETTIYPPQRLDSLKRCAEVIAKLATEEFYAGQPLAAFSIHLVCLSIWNEALQICHAWAKEGRQFEVPEDVGSPDLEAVNVDKQQETCSAVEKEYVAACERGEALATRLSGIDGADRVPDAVELIFQAAVAAARNAAVHDVLGNNSKAWMSYDKAATLLHFLKEEAPSLPLNPPLVLGPSERTWLTETLHRVAERQSHFVTNTSRLSITPQ